MLRHLTIRRSVIAAASLSLALATIAGCGSESSDSGSSGSASASEVTSGDADKVLTVAYVGLPTAYGDPVQDEGEAYVGNGEYLLHPMQGGNTSWLAKSATMVDPSTWTITLRSDIKFQNGNPVTAEKVQSWLQHELETSGEFGGKYAGAKVEVTNPDELTVTLPSPNAAFAFELSNYALEVYDWDMVQSVGTDFNKLAGMGVFTGPYQISEIAPSKWTYTANPNYWQGTPALDKIELVNVADDQAAVKAVQAGEADVYFYADPALQPTVAAIPGLHFNPSPESAEYEALMPNINKAPWNDPVVRAALAMTIDSADIAKKGTFGVFPEIHGLFPSDSEFASDWVKPDIAGANKMLDEAGWVKGSDGVREKDGTRLSGNILTYMVNLTDLAVPIAEGAKAAGFDLQPKQLDYQVWQTNITDGSFDLTMQNNENFGINGDTGVSCVYYFNAAEPGASKGVGLDPAIKAACDSISDTRDPATVKSALMALQERNAEQAYVIPVTQRVSAWVTNDAWKSAAPDAFYLPITWQTAAG